MFAGGLHFVVSASVGALFALQDSLLQRTSSILQLFRNEPCYWPT